MPSEPESTRLPQAPEALLAFLRDAETRLDDLRFEIRAVREALESEPNPEAAKVADAITGTVHAVLPAMSGSGSGTFGWTGTASGHTPPDTTVSKWVTNAKKYGPPGARVAEFVVRIWSLLN